MRAFSFLPLVYIALTGCTMLSGRVSPTAPPVTLPPQEVLAVTWVDAGRLYYWRENLTPITLVDSNVVEAQFAPDGRHVAFTRGENRQPQALWVVQVDGSEPVELLPANIIAESEGEIVQIDTFTWTNNTTLVASGALVDESSVTPLHNLWEVTVDAPSPRKTFGTDGAGRLTLSPDGLHGAFVRPDAITTYDLQTGEAVVSLQFDQFVDSVPNRYATVDWLPDNASLYTAVPEAGADPSQVTAHLWQVFIDGRSEEVGTVNTLPDSLPRWSVDGRYMAWLRPGASDTTELVLAEANGANEQVYASSLDGSLGRLMWFDKTDQFVYRDSVGYWLGGPNLPPARLHPSEPVFNPRFHAGPYYVFVNAESAPYELRYSRMDVPSAPSLVIATLTDEQPRFDLVVTP